MLSAVGAILIINGMQIVVPRGAEAVTQYLPNGTAVTTITAAKSVATAKTAKKKKSRVTSTATMKRCVEGVEMEENTLARSSMRLTAQQGGSE